MGTLVAKRLRAQSSHKHKSLRSPVNLKVNVRRHKVQHHAEVTEA